MDALGVPGINGANNPKNLTLTDLLAGFFEAGFKLGENGANLNNLNQGNANNLQGLGLDQAGFGQLAGNAGQGDVGQILQEIMMLLEELLQGLTGQGQGNGQDPLTQLLNQLGLGNAGGQSQVSGQDPNVQNQQAANAQNQNAQQNQQVAGQDPNAQNQQAQVQQGANYQNNDTNVINFGIPQGVNYQNNDTNVINLGAPSQQNQQNKGPQMIFQNDKAGNLTYMYRDPQNPLSDQVVQRHNGQLQVVRGGF